MIEEGETFSLRGVARRAGVSQTAPYRHFSDRDQLESAVAAQGFRTLDVLLFPPDQPTDPVEFAVTYVNFALDRPQMFRLMFGTECDNSSDERVQAATQLRTNLAAKLPPAEGLALALWSTAHGLAFLHLDGKLSPQPRKAVEERVRLALGALTKKG